MREKSKKIFTVMLASFLAATFFMSSLISVEASDTLVTEEAKIDFLRSIGTTDEALSSYNLQLGILHTHGSLKFSTVHTYFYFQWLSVIS